MERSFRFFLPGISMDEFEIAPDGERVAGFHSVEDVNGSRVVAEIEIKDKVVLAPGPNPSIRVCPNDGAEESFKIPLNRRRMLFGLSKLGEPDLS